MELMVSFFVFIIGLVIGSFLNVCIYRIPEEQSIINPPSHCPKCNNRLKAVDLIPVFSYLIMRGKCRYCKEKISIRYMLVELFTGILFLFVYNNHHISSATIYYLILVSLLIVITFIDIDHYIIPDSLIIFGILFSIVFNILFELIDFKNLILGGVLCGGTVFIFVIILEFIVKQEVMGRGDIKLFIMLGTFFGIKGGFISVILSVYLGAIYGVIVIVYSKINKRDYNSVIPYGPFISLAAIIQILI